MTTMMMTTTTMINDLDDDRPNNRNVKYFGIVTYDEDDGVDDAINLFVSDCMDKITQIRKLTVIS